MRVLQCHANSQGNCYIIQRSIVIKNNIFLPGAQASFPTKNLQAQRPSSPIPPGDSEMLRPSRSSRAWG